MKTAHNTTGLNSSSGSGGLASRALPVSGRLWLPLLALAAALAVGLVLLLPGGPLQAQSVGANCEENAGKTGYDCDYAENGKGPVATFTAVDPEGAAVSWDLDDTWRGHSNALFSISKDGVLSFNSSPNYEATDTDNTYEVTVRATDNMYGIAGVDGEATTKLVTVTVKNVEEPGSVALTVNAPATASRCCSRRWARR